jgi:hypothetical protein
VGHFISDDRLIRLGHQLLCALFAAYDFPDLYRDRGDYPHHEPDPIDDLRSLEDSDFSEHLVMLSALARVNDDERQTLSTVEKVLPNGVGALEENGTTKPLTPREACNKIVHAKKISYELDWCEEHPIWNRFYEKQRAEVRGKFKNPRITVTGATQSGREWKAEINAINFLLAVSTEYWKWNPGNGGVL